MGEEGFDCFNTTSLKTVPSPLSGKVESGAIRAYNLDHADHTFISLLGSVFVLANMWLNRDHTKYFHGSSFS